jgi:hypothetical protein
MTDWLPMGADPTEEQALVSGVPAWMRRPLKGWLRSATHYTTGGRVRQVVADLDLLRAFDSKMRMERLLVSNVLEDRNFSTLEDVLMANQEIYFQLLDFLVHHHSDPSHGDPDHLTSLEEVLLESGSQWKVGSRNGNAGLEHRVPLGVQLAAEAAIDTPGHAGQLLAEAWRGAFGVHPNPETSYRNAVLAVEAASIPLVSPNNRGATLGTVFAQMRDQRDWALEIRKQHQDYPAPAVLLGMIQMLWAGQGRHAGQPDWTPNTQAEAEAAVMLAVSLVQWFSSGAIARRTS